MQFAPERVREAREAAGLTQEDLASGIDKRLQRRNPMRARNVNRWETGKNEPRPETLAAIAAETGKPLEFFFRSGANGATPAGGASAGAVQRRHAGRAVRGAASQGVRKSAL